MAAPRDGPAWQGSGWSWAPRAGGGRSQHETPRRTATRGQACRGTPGPCACSHCLVSWAGQESAVGSRTVIGDYIRPLPLPGDKPEPLSVKPAFLSRSASPRCRFESDVSSGRRACSWWEREGPPAFLPPPSSCSSIPQLPISSLYRLSGHRLQAVFLHVSASAPSDS